MALIYAGEESMIRPRLFGPGLRLDFPILEDLLAEGDTDYAISGLRRRDGRPMGVSRSREPARFQRRTVHWLPVPAVAAVADRGADQPRLTADSLLEVSLSTEAQTAGDAAT